MTSSNEVVHVDLPDWAKLTLKALDQKKATETNYENMFCSCSNKKNNFKLF